MSLNTISAQNLHAVSYAPETFSTNNNYGYSPLVKGDDAPSFSLFKKHFISGDISLNFLVKDFFIRLSDLLSGRQPLVLLFYNTGDRNMPKVKALSSLSKDVEIMGGRLLIVTNSAPGYFENNLWLNNNVNIFYDANNFLAKRFGVYDAGNPVWHWVSGIEDDFPLPATYVIDASGKIIFHHIDYVFELFKNDDLKDEFVRTVLTTVYQNAEKNIKALAV